MLEPPKAHLLKQKDEIYLNVIVAKAEKSDEMIYGVNLSIVNNGKSAGKFRIGKAPTTTE